jgi:hypothetical protein
MEEYTQEQIEQMESQYEYEKMMNEFIYQES